MESKFSFFFFFFKYDEIIFIILWVKDNWKLSIGIEIWKLTQTWKVYQPKNMLFLPHSNFQACFFGLPCTISVSYIIARFFPCQNCLTNKWLFMFMQYATHLVWTDEHLKKQLCHISIMPMKIIIRRTWPEKSIFPNPRANKKKCSATNVWHVKRSSQID